MNKSPVHNISPSLVTYFDKVSLTTDMSPIRYREVQVMPCHDAFDKHFVDATKVLLDLDAHDQP